MGRAVLARLGLALVRFRLVLVGLVLVGLVLVEVESLVVSFDDCDLCVFVMEMLLTRMHRL
jgi:hypothetical protein